jgi:hypothetical protein
LGVLGWGVGGKHFVLGIYQNRVIEISWSILKTLSQIQIEFWGITVNSLFILMAWICAPHQHNISALAILWISFWVSW